MEKILHKCRHEDFVYLSNVLDNYASLTDDKKRKELLNQSESNPKKKKELISLINKQIKYFGSSDVAYLVRGIFSNEAGVSSSELISDVCEKLNVKIKIGGSTELMLEKMVGQVVEKEMLSKTPEELSESFRELGVADLDSKKILEYLKQNGKVAVLPILMQVLGPKITLGIIETIVIGLIANIIGREAAKQLVKELIKRNPWMNALGPIVWVASGTWLAFDLQGPAFRKTVPICLYLGMVSLRDGVEIE